MVLYSVCVACDFFKRKDLVILLMCVVLRLVAVNLKSIAFTHCLDDLGGQVFAMFVLTVAAAEAAIGLAILVVLFRNQRTINVEDIDTLKG